MRLTDRSSAMTGQGRRWKRRCCSLPQAQKMYFVYLKATDFLTVLQEMEHDRRVLYTSKTVRAANEMVSSCSVLQRESLDQDTRHHLDKSPSRGAGL
jgi:hypothetical protein